MAKGGRITVAAVARLKPGETLWDGAIPGFGARCQRSGKTYFLKYRADGRQRFYTMKSGLAPEQARREAKRLIGEIASGIDPAAVKAEARKAKLVASETAFDKLARRFVARMKKRGDWRPRTAYEVERIYESYIVPEWDSRPIGDIRRSDVAALLDKVEDGSGLVMADRVLAWVRRLFNWHAANDDDFKTPIVRGMARIKKPSARARERTLNDDEIRAIWTACDQAKPPIFGPLVRFLFLTAQRRQDCAGMTRAEVDGNLWIIPPARYKTKVKGGHSVPLTDDALAILDGLPRWETYYFTTADEAPFSGFSKAKRELDKLCCVEDWRLHDIRRTARSLMSRAGVPSDHAERVLGHAIGGIEGVYDRFAYAAEKRAALEKLAGLVRLILANQGGEVVEIGGRTHRAL
jgi:integrase